MTAGAHETTVDPADREWEAWDDPTRGSLRWCLLDDGTGTPEEPTTVGVAELAADGRLNRHRHTATELYVVLEGEAVVTVDGTDRQVGPGTLVRLPGDVEHGIRTAGGPVRFLFVFPGASFDEVVYRFD
jgi:quercetin dioxygenase-like cupin family protein